MRSREAGPAISLKASFYDLPGAWQFDALLSWSGGFVATNELALGKMLRFVMTGMSVVVTLILIVMALYVHALRIRASY